METFLLMAVAIPLVTAVAVYGRRSNDTAWREVGSRLKFELRGSGGRSVLEGDLATAHIVVDVVERQRERKQTAWTRIRATTDIPPGLLVGGEGFWKKWNAAQGDESVDMAGVAFDEHVIVRGAVPQIFALLNGDTRSQFRELERRYRTFVAEGIVHVEHLGVMRDVEELARLVRRVATLAMALSLQGPSIADRLGANVATDSNALVRLRNLELLLDRYPDSESARLACQHALGDRSHPVAVLAALQSGPEGIPALERVITDQKADQDLRLQSLGQLIGLVELDEAIAILSHAVAEEPALRDTAVVTLASIGHDPGADVLASLLESETAEGWIAYAQSIAALERTDMTEPLELLLEEEATADVVTLILQALETDERFAQAEPLTFPIPSDLRVDLDVQQAAQDAMRALCGWSFDVGRVEGETEEEEPVEPEESAGEATFERLDDKDAAAEAEPQEREAPQPTSADGSEVEFEPQAD
ncbi:MAG: hypothetical protein ACPGU1_03325 [Myxococcota bacterium]